MALDILMKDQLYCREKNQLYDCFKAWRRRVEMLMTSMALMKEHQDFNSHCIKVGWGDRTHAHRNSRSYK